MLKNTKLTDIIDYKRIIIYFFVSLTIFGFIYIGSIEIFFNNWKEYGYNFIAFFKNILPEYILYSLIFTASTYIISCFGTIIRKIVEILLITTLIFSLINLVFFPVNILLDGRESVNVFSKTGITNIVLLFVILLITIFIYVKSEDKNKLLVLSGFICSVYIVFNAIFAVTNSTYEEKVSTTMQLSTLPEDILRLSKEKNVIYLVLDQFDSSYFDEILAGNDGNVYKEIFKDFTYFSNYASAHPTTVFSGVASMAGKPYDNSMPYETEFHKKVFSEGNSLFEILNKEGYDNIVYFRGMNGPIIYAPQIELYSNKTTGVYNKAPKYMGNKYIQASIYRFVPYVLRNNVKTLLATSDKDGWDFKFLQMINENDIYINNKNVFMVFHLQGAHDPHVINEHLEYDKNANAVSQSKAALKLTKMFLNKIKAKSPILYDNSLIVVTTDHGYWKPNALCLIKPIKAKNDDMIIDERPLSQIYIKDVIYDLLNGKKIDEIDTSKKRFFYDYDYIRELENGYYANIYMYELPNKLTTDKKYELSKVYRAPSGIINTNKLELQFPKDYSNFPDGVVLSDGWQQDVEGLVTNEDYKIISFILEENIKKKIKITMEYESGGDNNYLYLRTYDRDNRTRIKQGPLKLDKTTLTHSLEAENDIILQFNTKNRLTVKKIILEIE